MVAIEYILGLHREVGTIQSISKIWPYSVCDHISVFGEEKRKTPLTQSHYHRPHRVDRISVIGDVYDVDSDREALVEDDW